MKWSLVLAIVVVAAVFGWYLRSRRQDTHRLDEIHITQDAEDKEV